MEGQSDRSLADGGASPWGNLVGAILRPGRTFDRVREHPALLAPYLVLTAASLGAATLSLGKIGELTAEAAKAAGPVPPEIVDQMRLGLMIGGLVGAAAWPVLWGAILAGILSLAQWFVGGEARFKQLMSVAGYASLPATVLGGLLKGFLVRSTPVADVMLVTTSAAALLPREQFGTWAYRLATLVDPFALWTLVLLVIGFAAVNRFQSRRAAAVVVPLWLVVNLVGLVLAGNRTGGAA